MKQLGVAAVLALMAVPVHAEPLTGRLELACWGDRRPPHQISTAAPVPYHLLVK